MNTQSIIMISMAVLCLVIGYLLRKKIQREMREKEDGKTKRKRRT